MKKSFWEYIWPQDSINHRLFHIEGELIKLVEAIKELGELMSAELEALRAEVEENTAVDQSAITLLQGLAAQIEALKQDPVALQELADKLNASSEALAAAVAANTPAE